VDVLCLGAYILDVLGRPIEELPKTQNSVLIDEIRLTAAGTAGGTSVDLARLGLTVVAAGAIGDDEAGEFLTMLLRRHGVDTGHLAVKPGLRTATTMLPIRSDGTRAAWHMRGANAVFGAADVPRHLLEDVRFVHFGGVGALPGLDGPDCVSLLAAARRAGRTVTADCLGFKRADTAELLAGYLPYVDVFLPNDEEALLITGASGVAEAAAEFRRMGAAAVIVTMGAQGCLISTAQGDRRLPAFDVPAVDATGCGDAFTAGVIAGLAQGWPLERAAELGTAAASLTVQGLGSDAGNLSLARVLDHLASAPRRRLT